MRIMWKLIACVLVFAASAPGSAVELKGSFVQGGMVIGRTSADAKVSYQGNKLKVSDQGYFVFGFGRDAPLKSELKIHFANGFEEIEPVTIKKRQYDEQHINGLPEEKVEPSKKEYERIWAEQKLINRARARNDARQDFLQECVWPVKGPISGVFGSRRILNGKPKRPHSGLDIAVPQGTTVVAPMSGVVTLAHADMFYTGGTLIIQHGQGISSMYFHLSKILVKEGQDVKQGEPVAEVGMTGRATGPHLHWSVTWFNTKLDPALLVPPKNEANTKNKTQTRRPQTL